MITLTLLITSFFLSSKFIPVQRNVRACISWIESSDFPDYFVDLNINSVNSTVVWEVYDTHPNDASLSCFFMDDKWYCANDMFLKSQVNNEDSY